MCSNRKPSAAERVSSSPAIAVRVVRASCRGPDAGCRYLLPSHVGRLAMRSFYLISASFSPPQRRGRRSEKMERQHGQARHRGGVHRAERDNSSAQAARMAKRSVCRWTGWPSMTVYAARERGSAKRQRAPFTAGRAYRDSARQASSPVRSGKGAADSIGNRSRPCWRRPTASWRTSLRV
jgi:hypothetical protein